MTDQQEEQIAMSVQEALSSALEAWFDRHDDIRFTGGMNIAVGAIIGFAAAEAAEVRSPEPLRERFIAEATDIFETALRQACKMFDVQEG